MGQDFRELREMNESDDPRRIHWKSTARVGKPYVAETDKDAQELVEIVLDPKPLGSRKEDLEQVEQNIRAAGTIIRDTTLRRTTARLVIPGHASMTADDRSAAVALLVDLALLNPIKAAKLPPPVGINASSILIGPRASTRGQPFRLPIPPPGKGGGLR
jgi:uncharacterized protein (DUF58 family)